MISHIFFIEIVFFLYWLVISYHIYLWFRSFFKTLSVLNCASGAVTDHLR